MSVSGLLVCLSGGTEEGKECVDERDMDMENGVLCLYRVAQVDVENLQLSWIWDVPPSCLGSR